MTEVADRIARSLGKEVRTLEPIRGGGYTLSERYRVHLAGGDTVFAKVATSDDLAGWFRLEARLYEELRGAPYMPELRGFDDDGVSPILMLEDLTDGTWPPPWPDGGVDAVLRALDEVHGTKPPSGLPSGESWRDLLIAWPAILDEPEPFLALGLASRDWLEHAGPTLSAAADSAQLGGDAFLHLDVRSDNICVRDGRAYLVDWNWATVGNAMLDTVFWLPSLESEGGPPPEAVIGRVAAEFAALVAGFFASRAGLPPIEGAPTVRTVQLTQARYALPWACRALGLPPPDQG